MRSRFLATIVCAFALIGSAAGAAYGGETTGPSNPTTGGSGNPTGAPAHANSICAYSGQNNPADGADAGSGRTQSYGQIVKTIGGKAANGDPGPSGPGVECNGHSGALAGGGPTP